jgi:hypothetical protein
MTALLVRSALESALWNMSPALATSFENAGYMNADGTAGTPDAATPYQRVTLLLAEPANVEFGPGYTEQGFLQVDLNYPLAAGPHDATARAELIRSTFHRGASFTASGVTVNIERTPEIMPARVEEDRFIVPVRIRFYSHQGS